MKNSIIVLIAAIIIQSCVSTDKTHKDYFGYNNNPKYENPKQEPAKNEYPIIHSESQGERTVQDKSIYIYNFNNFPAPYEPRYLFYPEPNDFSLFLYFGNVYYDPFLDYNLIYYPYSRHHHSIIYYPYPYYWDYYFWHYRPRVVYIPYEKENERPKTVRTFGPSRGDYNYDNESTPTKEKRSTSRSGERSKIAPPSDNQDSGDKPLKLKLPEKSNAPSGSPGRSGTQEPSPQKTPTKQERSSTRPK